MAGRPTKAEQQASALAALRAPAPEPHEDPATVAGLAALGIEPLLTLDEVAAWLRRPRETVRKWKSRGGGPQVIRVGGELRYRRADVEAWLRDQTGAA